MNKTYLLFEPRKTQPGNSSESISRCTSRDDRSKLFSGPGCSRRQGIWQVHPLLYRSPCSRAGFRRIEGVNIAVCTQRRDRVQRRGRSHLFLARANVYALASAYIISRARLACMLCIFEGPALFRARSCIAPLTWYAEIRGTRGYWFTRNGTAGW